MDERTWLETDDVAAMLRLLDADLTRVDVPRGSPLVDYWKRGGLSARKLRLFACGCSRVVWHELRDERSRSAVEAAERFADGEATERELVTASLSVQDVGDKDWSAYPALAIGDGHAITAAFQSCWSIPRRAAQLPPLARQAALLRCIAGNPFRPVVVDPLWLTVDVMRLAQDAYDSCDFSFLALVADALEEAGCPPDRALTWEERETFACAVCGNRPDEHGELEHGRGCYTQSEDGGGSEFVEEATSRVPNELLAHLRSPGPHVRGCWALDVLLGLG